jgi:hypothetical protein
MTTAQVALLRQLRRTLVTTIRQGLPIPPDDYQVLFILVTPSTTESAKSYTATRDHVYKVEPSDIVNNIVTFKYPDDPTTTDPDSPVYTRCVHYYIHTSPHLYLPSIFRTVWQKVSTPTGHTYNLIAFQATPEV